MKKNKLIIALSLVFSLPLAHADLKIRGLPQSENKSSVTYSTKVVADSTTLQKSSDQILLQNSQPSLQGSLKQKPELLPVIDNTNTTTKENLDLAAININSESSDVLLESEKAEKSANKNLKYKAVISHIGIPSPSLSKVKGFANQLPLIEALKQVTPVGWHAKKEKDSNINVNMPISWRADGSQNWVEVLTIIANEYKFDLTIDWTNQELKLSGGVPSETVYEPVDYSKKEVKPVSLSPEKSQEKPMTEEQLLKSIKEEETAKKAEVPSLKSSVPESKKSEKSTAKKSNKNKEKPVTDSASADNKAELAKDLKEPSEEKLSDPTKSENLETVEAKKPEIKDPQSALMANVASANININKADVINKQDSKEWILKSSSTLKENIHNWAKKANWQVAWEEGTVDYPIDFDVTLRGDFDDEENGPVAQVALAYRQAHQPLVFSFKTGNKVLVVRNYVFEQKLFRESWQKFGKEN